ncbi:55e703dd-ecd4-46a4-8145-48db3e327d6c [Thermothielavioides terrestris]|jgi:hypothetical protein|uniref:Uncharacterized protein n=2 Tax=Thermothielavioides terrestris TaxID=2587410 RepID=G2R9I8_THETT|nr:uncharacterized protein THITE_2120068 [Thermothielavioides terrestris NRRL 8126]AEO69532.1 hypothetical protein THITE_2120068 [Thermothielavioides terrestris NRRL 8126]SPQ26051.1 55e703dd-ecd4-46a4-8145-48db3e327d6c [Thermothielavioides terrestris]
MGYLLYSLIFLVLLSGTALFVTRARWLPAAQESLAQLRRPRFPGSDYLYSRLGPAPPGSFEDDMEAGLSSATFDLTGNVEGGDGRAGLDDAAKREILKIMKKRRLKFDEARRVYMEQRFRENGIGPDGRPRDPKFVSFS